MANPRGGLKPSGMSLSIKFALVISGVSAALIIIMGLIVYQQVSKTLDSEINKRGAGLVRQLSGRCVSYHNDYVKRLAEYTRREAALQKKQKAVKDDADRAAKVRVIITERKTLRVEKLAVRDAMIESMETYLNTMVYLPGTQKTGDVLTAFCLEDGKAGSPKDIQGGRELSDITPESSTKMQGVISVEKGWATIGGNAVQVRMFRMPVFGGTERPEAAVLLSATRINETQSQIKWAIVLSTVMAIAIGAGVSFLLAGQVTNPVKRLVEDIEIVAGGDLDHETLATSTDEIGILADTFNVMTKRIHEAHGQQLEHKAREHELNIATEIQSNLLPKKIPKLEHYGLGAFYRPSKEVGGDYYDFIQIDETHLGIVVADVSGKGVPGSMVMTMARSLIRMEAVRNLSAADTFIKTNRVIAQDIKRGMFVTAMYVILDTENHTLQVASAGHNPMVLYRDKLGKCSLVNPKGIALGFDKGPIFERTITEETVQLQPGDRVVLYTDGVPEAMSPDQEEYGEKRFYKLVQANSTKSSNQFVNLLVDSLEQWKGDGAEQSDDITITTFRLLKGK